MEGALHTFSYRAIDSGGQPIDDTIRASDRGNALSLLSRSGLVLVDMREVADGTARRGVAWRGQSRARLERATLIRQLAVMTRARIDLMAAIEVIRADFPSGETREAIGLLAAGLRRGEPFDKALAAALPMLPPYVYALVETGSATGRIDQVLDQAGQHLEFERELRAEFRAALAYPAFLMSAGLLAITFMFMIVVPRFTAMIGARRQTLSGFSAWILDTGQAVNAHPIALLIAFAAMLCFAGWIVTDPSAARTKLWLADQLPVVRPLTLARQRAGWARIMAFAMSKGVDFLHAHRLALRASEPGVFRDSLDGVEAALRAGVAPADAIAAGGALPAIDLSLIRAGQQAGAMAEMFQVIAEHNERNLRAALKRTTRIAEQAAIALVSIAIGAIVIGLVTAMTSVYDAIR